MLVLRDMLGSDKGKMWRLCLLRDLADFKISLPALDADRTRPMAWPGASVAGRGGSRRMRPFNQVRVRVESGALSGASLSVVVIPAGPWASRGSAGPWGGGRRGSPVLGSGFTWRCSHDARHEPVGRVHADPGSPCRSGPGWTGVFRRLLRAGSRGPGRGLGPPP